MKRARVHSRMFSGTDFLHKAIDIITADIDVRPLETPDNPGAFGFYTVQSTWSELEMTLRGMSHGEVSTIEGVVYALNQHVKRWREENEVPF